MEVASGWLLLNHGKYWEIRTAHQVNATERKRRQRERERAMSESSPAPDGSSGELQA